MIIGGNPFITAAGEATPVPEGEAFLDGTYFTDDTGWTD